MRQLGPQQALLVVHHHHQLPQLATPCPVLLQLVRACLPAAPVKICQVARDRPVSKDPQVLQLLPRDHLASPPAATKVRPLKARPTLLR